MSLYLGLLLAILLEYVRPGGYFPIIDAVKVNSLVPLLVLLMTIFYKDGLDHKKIFGHPNSKWILFYMFLLVASILLSDVTHNSLTVFQTVLGYIFFYYMILRLVTTLERLQGIMAVLVLSHVIVLGLNPVLITNPEVRSYIFGHTFMGDGNDFSLSVAIVLPMCVYLFLESKKIIFKIYYLLSFFGLTLGVIGTQSRGATIALVAVFLYLWFMAKRKIVGFVAILLVGIGVAFYAPDVYFERMNTVSHYEDDGSAMGRIIAWKTAMRMVARYPLTGVGTGHFAVKLGTEFRPAEWGNKNLPWLTAHSMYFLTIGELGIPGITFLLAIIISNFFRNNRLLGLANGHVLASVRRYGLIIMFLNGSLIAFAFGGAFLSAIYYPHLYVLMGILTATGFLLESEMRSQVVVEKQDVSVNFWEKSPSKTVWRD